MSHPGNTLARYPDSTQAPQLSNTPALHRVNPPRARSTPAPHRTHNDPAPYQVQPPFRIEPITSQHCLGALPGAQKQKIGPNCNFFAIGNCCELPNRESRHKNAAKMAYFKTEGTEKSP